MPRHAHPLSDLQVRNARPREAPYKLVDGGGLYIEISPSGSKLWKMKYQRPGGREGKLSFGPYPDVSLVSAREKRAEARRLIADDIDPGVVRDEVKKAKRDTGGSTFEAVAREWHETMREQWQPQTAKNILHRLSTDIFPHIGSKQIAALTSKDLIHAARQIEKRGALEVARRVTADVSRVFVYAFHCGLTERNPAMMLTKVLRPRQKGHFAAIDADQLPGLIKALTRNEACMGPIVRIAMRLMMLIFVRTSELIETPWKEIELEKGEWIIPWQRMKRGKRKLNPDRTDHHVCLSRQALELLRQLHGYTGEGELLFPNMRTPGRPMSNMALLKALARMGYKGDMTGHGFRALAMSTLKERLHYRHEVVDRQLAHAQKDKLESAYDRARYLDERRDMMQRWADYLDDVERGELTPSAAQSKPRGSL
ncbi:MAG: integrase arm-type DNA-binding domain-containing protein [Burkholderiaceae bacterium]|nr:integrase arm-type DNA-binding domain-containing protein [Burkholderiaceae bacterium]